MEITGVNLLEAALSLLRDPKKWCKYTFALNSLGFEVEPTDPSAQRWCFVGALEKYAPFHSPARTVARIFIYQAIEEVTGSKTASMPYVNDTLGYNVVLNVLEKALTLAKESIHDSARTLGAGA